MTCCAAMWELQSVWWVLQRRSREWGPKAGEFGRWHLCAHGPGEASGAGAFVLARQGDALASAGTGSGRALAPLSASARHQCVVVCGCLVSVVMLEFRDEAFVVKSAVWA